MGVALAACDYHGTNPDFPTCADVPLFTLVPAAPSPKSRAATPLSDAALTVTSIRGLHAAEIWTSFAREDCGYGNSPRDWYVVVP